MFIRRLPEESVLEIEDQLHQHFTSEGLAGDALYSAIRTALDGKVSDLPFEFTGDQTDIVPVIFTDDAFAIMAGHLMPGDVTYYGIAERVSVYGETVVVEWQFGGCASMPKRFHARTQVQVLARVLEE